MKIHHTFEFSLTAASRNGEQNHREVRYTPTQSCDAPNDAARRQIDDMKKKKKSNNQTGLTHCAAAVAIAAPATPRPHTNISTGSSTRFTAPTTIALLRPAFGSPMPLH